MISLAEYFIDCHHRKVDWKLFGNNIIVLPDWWAITTASAVSLLMTFLLDNVLRQTCQGFCFNRWSHLVIHFSLLCSVWLLLNLLIFIEAVGVLIFSYTALWLCFCWISTDNVFADLYIIFTPGKDLPDVLLNRVQHNYVTSIMLHLMTDFMLSDF